MNELTLIVLRRARWRSAVPLLLAALVWVARAGSAEADACSSCPAPSTSDLEALVGPPITDLPFGTRVETQACECSYAVSGTPVVAEGPPQFVLRGRGEVWNCPESSSEDLISIEVAEGDSTSWTLTSELSATMKAVALEIAAKVTSGVGGGHTVSEIKRVQKTLRPAVGHRIPWEGYFEVADYTLTLEFDVSRRWSWWSKAFATGDVVISSGSVYMACGKEQASLTRRASIGYRFHLADAPCGAGPATPTDLGWWPMPPPALPPPTTPGSGGPPPNAPGSPPPPVAVPPSPPTSGPPPVSPDDRDDDRPAGQAPAPSRPGLPPGPPVPPLPTSPVPPPSPTNPEPQDSAALGESPTGKLFDWGGPPPGALSRAPGESAPPR